VGFLWDSIREDGSLPIDTNLATWVTTLSINALPDEKIDLSEPRYLVKYLLDQQHRVEHPFTRARPGGWAWTDLSGGVPDGDDTSGALLALARLRPFASEDSRLPAAANRAMEWLLEIQNRDGGVPTFCRGWGKLPFDQSCPDLTAHALQAWRAWRTEAPEGLRRRVDIGRARAVRYLRASQREDGAWLPRWFGNQGVPDHSNPIYGTAQALRALWKELPETDPATQKAVHFLLSAQNADGSWSAHPGIAPTIEESALALAALASSRDPALASAIERGACWLMDRLGKIEELPSAPIGLYFASLWYDEKLYPLVWMVLALRKAREYFAQVGR
jgi:squalene-hopene/tetraprenyl-beta-curcumene cyclase